MAADRYSWLGYVAWPAVALVVVLLVFRSGVGPASDVELGPIKLKFSAESARKVPLPASDVAEALAKLHPKEVDLLITTGDFFVDVCTPEGLTPEAMSVKSNYPEQTRLFANLEKVGLAEHRPDVREQRSPNDPTDSWCKPGQAIQASLSDKGKEARRYLLNVLASSITISPSND